MMYLPHLKLVSSTLQTAVTTNEYYRQAQRILKTLAHYDMAFLRDDSAWYWTRSAKIGQ